MGSFGNYLQNLWQSTFGQKSYKTDESYKAGMQELRDFYNQIDFEKYVPQKLEFEDSPTYERLSFEEKSDDKIKSEAADSLKEYYDANTERIKIDDETAKKQKEQMKLDAEDAASAKHDQIALAFGEAKENVKNDSLKRGIARSSINEKKQGMLESQKNDLLSQNNNSLIQKIRDIDSELSDLSLKREKALNDFNVAYATKLTTQINTLKKEQESKKKDVIKYNNSLAEKEFSEGISKEIKAEDEFKKALDNYESLRPILKEELYGTMYNKLDAILSKLSAKEARTALLEDSSFRFYLDTTWYAKLYNKYVSKWG